MVTARCGRHRLLVHVAVGALSVSRHDSPCLTKILKTTKTTASTHAFAAPQAVFRHANSARSHRRALRAGAFDSAAMASTSAFIARTAKRVTGRELFFIR